MVILDLLVCVEIHPLPTGTTWRRFWSDVRMGGCDLQKCDPYTPTLHFLRFPHAFSVPKKNHTWAEGKRSIFIGWPWLASTSQSLVVKPIFYPEIFQFNPSFSNVLSKFRTHIQWFSQNMTLFSSLNFQVKNIFVQFYFPFLLVHPLVSQLQCLNPSFPS